MTLYQSRNQMDSSNTKDRAQVLLLMNHVRNLQNQVAQMGPRSDVMEVGGGDTTTDATQLLLNQMKSFQSQINEMKSGQRQPNKPTGEQTRGRYINEFQYNHCLILGLEWV